MSLCILFISVLSDEAIRVGLERSENVLFRWLVFFTAMVAVGVLGELAEYILLTDRLSRSESRTGKVRFAFRRRVHRLAKYGAWAIFIGVAGELVIEYLQSNAQSRAREFNATVLNKHGSAIMDLSAIAARARSDSEIAINQSGQAIGRAATAEQASGRAAENAQNALSDANEAEEQTARLHAFLTPRSLTQKEQDDLRDALKPLADAKVPILVTGSMAAGALTFQVWKSLKDAGFDRAEFKEVNQDLGYGMNVFASEKYGFLAEKLAAILLHAGCGPMMGGIGTVPDGERIIILIRDVRSAPLPNNR